MAATNPVREGGCACGAVRFTVRGEPLRAGLCHCLTCRKADASAFNAFVIFAAGQVEVSGELVGWESSPGYDRRFCPKCGSSVVGGDGEEVEVSMGSFDERACSSPNMSCGSAAASRGSPRFMSASTQ